MASIKKRGNTYLVTVSKGYDVQGTKLTASKSIKLDPSLTKKQVEKEIKRLADEFEQRVKTGQYLDGGKITLQEFSDLWLRDYAEKQLAPKTVEGYRNLLSGRIIPALGHIKMQLLQPTHLIQFYANLEEPGMRLDTHFTAKSELVELIKQSGSRKGVTAFAHLAGITVATASNIYHGKPTTAAIANKIAARFEQDPKKLFTAVDNEKKLSANSVAHYHRLLSSILSTAVQWQIISGNPAERVRPPRGAREEGHHYDEDQIEYMLNLLENEDIRLKTIIYMAIFLGMRLGELTGLEWSDVDLEKNLISVMRSSQYLNDPNKPKHDHILTKDPKNKSSRRTVSLPQTVAQVLKKYKAWQDEERLQIGDLWQDHDRLFTQWDGSPIFPQTPSNWFRKFREKHHLPPLTFHQLRHSNASLLIGQGVDVATIGRRLGHTTPATTMKIYAHALRRPDQEASDKLDALFKKKVGSGTAKQA